MLAHPLRSRLLSALRLHGPATATDLADRLDTNTGATSYHLRKLESVGLVEDTGDGEGKRRRVGGRRAAATRGSPATSPATRTPRRRSTWLTRDYVRTAAEQMQRWMDVEQAWPADVAGRARRRRRRGEVTAAQARAMWDEISEVVARYREAGAERSRRPAGLGLAHDAPAGLTAGA